MTSRTASVEPVGEKAVPSIAVLPFANMSADPEQDYFCEGMAEEIINALTKLEGLKVASRTSAFQFKGQSQDIRRIGEVLNVKTVLEGSVRKAGNQLRINAQLINAEDGYHLWSERYDRDMDDVFAVQDEIARAIVEKLRVKLVCKQDGLLVTLKTESLDAYNLYLQGRYYWARRYAGFFEKAIECFQQAIARDPSYAAAHAGLAEGYGVLGINGILPPAKAATKTREAAEQAATLDDGLAEAHRSLGLLRCFFDWNGTNRVHR